MAMSRQFADVMNRFSGDCEPVSEGLNPGVITDEYRSRPSRSATQTVLARAIEVEVIPRLMLAHRPPKPQRLKTKRRARTISNEEIIDFIRISVHHDIGVAEAYVDALIGGGASIEQIFSKLFAPAARLLGEFWESDQCSFTDVTIGLSRIEQLVHELSPLFEAEGEAQITTKSALLIPLPGEHHTLGLLMVEENLRREGWNVWSPRSAREQELIVALRHEHYDLIGISATCELPVERLAALIKAMKTASQNREVVVMIGGRACNARPGCVAEVGADATDTDGKHIAARFQALAEPSRTH